MISFDAQLHVVNSVVCANDSFISTAFQNELLTIGNATIFLRPGLLKKYTVSGLFDSITDNGP